MSTMSWWKARLAPVVLLLLPACNQPESVLTPSSLTGDVTGLPAIFEDLTEKDDVLVNLRLAHEMKDGSEFARVLSNDFTFYFAPGDVDNASVLFSQWSRNLEISSFSYMIGLPGPTGIRPSSSLRPGAGTRSADFEERSWGFVKNYFFLNPFDELTSITLVLNYTAGDGAWQGYVDAGTGETRYRKDAGYALLVETVNGAQFQKLDGEARFVVRQSTGAGQWQLVEWFDIDPPSPPLNKDDALVVLEDAYNARDIGQINTLLDDDFIFFFSPDDVLEGNVSIEQWDRASELSATSHLFSPTYYPPNGDPITNIDLALSYPPDGWTSFNPPSHPSETWYQKLLSYSFTMIAGTSTYFIANNVQMQVTVRFTEVSGDSIWRIVTWRDGVGGSAERATSSQRVTEEVTWGQMKALYD